MVKEYHEEIEKADATLYEQENSKYLEALNEITDKDVKAFEDEGKLPSSISSIVTMGSDMRLYFKKIPTMTPSTGGFVFDDLSYDYLEHEEG